MLENLRPATFVQAAWSLEITPFEVVRLLVVADAVPRELQLTDRERGVLIQMGGMEWWWEGELPYADDPNPTRRLIRRRCRLPSRAGAARSSRSSRRRPRRSRPSSRRLWHGS